ncbi:endolytic transglycosylase MltG [Helicobacter sp. T3_23-1059]
MTRKRIIQTLSNFLDGVFIVILVFFWYLALPICTTQMISVPKGSIAGIITSLSNNGFEVNQFDKNILRFLGKPQYGIIDMSTGIKGVSIACDIQENLSDKSFNEISQTTNQNLSHLQMLNDIDSSTKYNISKGDFLYLLTSAKAAQSQITLIPGETMYFFIRQIAHKFSLSKEKLEVAFKQYSPYIEGVILPDTYKIPNGISEEEIIKNLVSFSLQKHKNLSIKMLGRYNQNEWFRYVAMASIIQKEAASIEEMPFVSAVIYNRLKLGMPLQMDGSLNYGEFSHSKVTPERIRKDKSQFNTYLNKGVPPTPVGSASINAIKAALNPAKVDYLYFVRNKEGKHSFSKTYKEHKENFKK